MKNYEKPILSYLQLQIAETCLTSGMNPYSPKATGNLFEDGLNF